MTAIAAYLLKAEGVYRTPGDNGYTFMILQNVRFAKKPSVAKNRLHASR